MESREGRALGHGLSRRGFIGGVAAAAAVPALARRTRAAEGDKSRVVIVKSEDQVRKFKDDAKAVDPMIDALMCSLMGTEKAEDAWAKVAKPDQRVSIKVNCLFPPVTTSPGVADAVVRSLLGVGVKPENIIVWDRSDKNMKRAGFTIQREPGKVRTMGVCEGRFNGKNKDLYSDEIKTGPIKTRLAKVLTEETDVLINVPFLKTHGLGGITASMKNHLGTVPNPRDFHRDGCRFLADLAAAEPIRAKTKLIIQDGTKAQFDRGPQHSPRHVWPYSGLLGSVDMAAHDRVAATEIGDKREKEGKRREFKPTSHIDRAGEIGLGQADLDKIEIVRVNI